MSLPLTPINPSSQLESLHTSQLQIPGVLPPEHPASRTDHRAEAIPTSSEGVATKPRTEIMDWDSFYREEGVAARPPLPAGDQAPAITTAVANLVYQK
jgi:hypothetical protein